MISPQFLYWRGIVTLEQRLDVTAFVNHLKRYPVYQSHVRSQGDGIARQWDAAIELETISYDMESVLSAPDFLPFILQDEIWDTVEAYLGQPPRLYSFNAFWTRPGTDPLDPNIQRPHRDRDDKRFLALFLYGTDVLTDDDGPHCFVLGSHKNNDGQHREAKPGEVMEKLYGPAGTMFFADTSGLHYGMKPKSHERLLAWARWGVSERPESYGWDKLAPIPASKLCSTFRVPNRVVDGTRLVIDWSH